MNRISRRLVKGDVDAEEQRALALESVMADSIQLDAAIGSEAMLESSPWRVKVADGDEAPMSAT